MTGSEQIKPIEDVRGISAIVAMARLVFSGIMDRFPELKIVVHHFGQ
jgi:predicted TIM-barrel fold metal-dependent hydrolase